MHLVLDRSGKWLYVANLQTGAVSLIPVLEDGSLGKIKELYFISGNGGPGYISHPHQTMLDRSGRWLAVPSQGRLQGVGKITLFEINGIEGTLRKHFAIKGRTGAEPRHCVFAPSNRFCYCVNEKDSTVAAYRFDAVSYTHLAILRYFFIFIGKCVHSREAETCRKRPRSAQECAKAHSFYKKGEKSWQN